MTVTASDWIPLKEAAGTLAAALFKVEGVTPTARRAAAAQHVAYAHTMIERLWRTGVLAFRAGRVETLSEGGSTVTALDTEIDPRNLDDAYFFEPGILSERGFDVTRFKATEISVSRPDFDEWLSRRVGTTSTPKAEKSPPSVDRLAKYLADVADGTQTKPEMKRLAEEHFGCTLPDKNRWRPAWKQIDDSQKRARGARVFKSGS